MGFKSVLIVSIATVVIGLVIFLGWNLYRFKSTDSTQEQLLIRDEVIFPRLVFDDRNIKNSSFLIQELALCDTSQLDVEIFDYKVLIIPVEFLGQVETTNLYENIPNKIITVEDCDQLALVDLNERFYVATESLEYSVDDSLYNYYPYQKCESKILPHVTFLCNEILSDTDYESDFFKRLLEFRDLPLWYNYDSSSKSTFEERSEILWLTSCTEKLDVKSSVYSSMIKQLQNL